MPVDIVAHQPVTHVLMDSMALLILRVEQRRNLLRLGVLSVVTV